MWRDIISDNQLLNLVAKHWILPIAAGYLPHAYNEHLAGGRLVALSKAPKPGVRQSTSRIPGDGSQPKVYCVNVSHPIENISKKAILEYSNLLLPLLTVQLSCIRLFEAS